MAKFCQFIKFSNRKFDVIEIFVLSLQNPIY